MEVVVPASASDFHFDSATSSPYISAPSSPKRFGDPFDYLCHYTSAPTSPSRAAAIFAESSSSPCFNWDERPSKSHSNTGGGGDGGADSGDDFAFDFSGQLEKGGGQPPDLTTADELFEEGKLKVRPLNPFTEVTIAAAERGRDRGQPTPYSMSSSSRSRKGSRSLSPMSHLSHWREGKGVGGIVEYFVTSSNSPTASTNTAPPATVATKCLNCSSGGSRKWRLRDLLLFRSASEGRATGNRSKDPLRKYTILSPSASLFSTKKKGVEDSRNSSFRSTDSSGSMRRASDIGSSMRRGNGPAVSAHEKHYRSNRIASEELKKKTPLPYKQSLFSCLRFNPAVSSIAKEFHSGYSFDNRQNKASIIL